MSVGMGRRRQDWEGGHLKRHRSKVFHLSPQPLSRAPTHTCGDAPHQGAHPPLPPHLFTPQAMPHIETMVDDKERLVFKVRPQPPGWEAADPYPPRTSPHLPSPLRSHLRSGRSPPVRNGSRPR